MPTSFLHAITPLREYSIICTLFPCCVGRSLGETAPKVDERSPESLSAGTTRQGFVAAGALSLRKDWLAWTPTLQYEDLLRCMLYVHM